MEARRRRHCGPSIERVPARRRRSEVAYLNRSGAIQYQGRLLGGQRDCACCLCCAALAISEVRCQPRQNSHTYSLRTVQIGLLPSRSASALSRRAAFKASFASLRSPSLCLPVLAQIGQLCFGRHLRWVSLRFASARLATDRRFLSCLCINCDPFRVLARERRPLSIPSRGPPAVVLSIFGRTRFRELGRSLPEFAGCSGQSTKQWWVVVRRQHALQPRPLLRMPGPAPAVPDPSRLLP